VNSEFDDVEPFGVDHDELSGLSQAMCFTLGVEWQMIAAAADGSEGFERPIHIENRERIAALLDRRGRKYTIAYMHDDKSEGWLWLQVPET